MNDDSFRNISPTSLPHNPSNVQTRYFYFLRAKRLRDRLGRELVGSPQSRQLARALYSVGQELVNLGVPVSALTANNLWN